MNQVASKERVPGQLDQVMPIPRKPGESATNYVYTDIRNQIVNLVLEPGRPIAKNALAERFNVSPTPVREALLRLSEEGLVDIVPQSGTSVSRIDIQHARELHFLRLSVEIEVVKVLVNNIDKSSLLLLKACIERQVTELSTGDQAEFKRRDNAFHEEMFKLAGVQGLTQLLDRRRGHYDRIRGLYLREKERRKVVIKEHRAIFSALKTQDANAAEAAVRKHLGKSLAVIDQIRNRHPKYFV